MSDIIVRKLAVPLGASSEACILFPTMVKTIVATFYNILLNDCPDYFLAISCSPGHLSVRTFEASSFDPQGDQESSTFDILVSTGLSEQHLYNILGILGPNTEGVVNVSNKSITIGSQVFNYENISL
jgi:hypothetical protein